MPTLLKFLWMKSDLRDLLQQWASTTKNPVNDLRTFFLAYPLSTDSRITHYLIFTSHVGVVSDGSDVSSSITETTVSDTQQQVLNAASPSVASNFLQQNLRANFNAAQRQAELPPNSLQIMTLPPVVSNPVSVAPPATILSPDLPSPTTQNSPDFAPQQQQQQQQIQPQIQTQPQQLHINASKRPHESICNGDVGSSLKQPKTSFAIWCYFFICRSNEACYTFCTNELDTLWPIAFWRDCCRHRRCVVHNTAITVLVVILHKYHNNLWSNTHLPKGRQTGPMVSKISSDKYIIRSMILRLHILIFLTHISHDWFTIRAVHTL